MCMEGVPVGEGRDLVVGKGSGRVLGARRVFNHC